MHNIDLKNSYTILFNPTPQNPPSIIAQLLIFPASHRPTITPPSYTPIQQSIPSKSSPFKLSHRDALQQRLSYTPGPSFSFVFRSIIHSHTSADSTHTHTHLPRREKKRLTRAPRSPWGLIYQARKHRMYACIRR